MRRIIVDHETYLWQLTHQHERPDACAERLTVYREGFKKSPLRVSFRQHDTWQVGYPEQGVIWSTQDKTSYNLNRPAIVASIIQQMIGAGWLPHVASTPFEVQNGLYLLTKGKQ